MKMYEGMNRGSTNTGAKVSVDGLMGKINGGDTGPNNTPAGNMQTRAPMAPGGAPVPYNNTPNLNPSVRGATAPTLSTPGGDGSVAHTFNYPSGPPAEVGPMPIDMMDYGPNSSGMRPLQGTASKR
jgi:hypothetical protein